MTYNETEIYCIFHSRQSLIYTVSAFYAKILVIVGIALPITHSIAAGGYESYDVSIPDFLCKRFTRKTT